MVTSTLVSILITFLVIVLVLWLIARLPVGGGANRSHRLSSLLSALFRC